MVQLRDEEAELLASEFDISGVVNDRINASLVSPRQPAPPRPTRTQMHLELKRAAARKTCGSARCRKSRRNADRPW